MTKAQRLRALQVEIYRLFRTDGHEIDRKREQAMKLQGVTGYRSGQCRNDDNALSHTYAEMRDGALLPMCGYGWNRSNGTRISIFRGNVGTEGDCRLCRMNVRLARTPVKTGIKMRRRWL